MRNMMDIFYAYIHSLKHTFLGQMMINSLGYPPQTSFIPVNHNLNTLILGTSKLKYLEIKIFLIFTSLPYMCNALVLDIQIII